MPGYSKHHDLTGIRIGRWTVLQKGPERYREREYMYLCRCDCGNEKFVRPASLHNGDSLSCGCLREEQKSADQYIGKKFGMLTVLAATGERVRRARMYRMRCDCGNEIVRRITQVKHGKTVSCGCQRGVRLAPGDGGLNLLFHEYQAGAKKRGLEFQISRDDFTALTAQACHYCGTLPHKTRTFLNAKTDHSRYTYNGIDRVDNIRGYTPNNCVPCCHRCNVAKGTMSRDEFIAMAREVVARHPP